MSHLRPSRGESPRKHPAILRNSVVSAANLPLPNCKIQSKLQNIDFTVKALNISNVQKINRYKNVISNMGTGTTRTRISPPIAFIGTSKTHAKADAAGWSSQSRKEKNLSVRN